MYPVGYIMSIPIVRHEGGVQRENYRFIRCIFCFRIESSIMSPEFPNYLIRSDKDSLGRTQRKAKFTGEHCQIQGAKFQVIAMRNAG
jgi:hypothetical protein